MTRPLGKPPIPNAISNPRDPVEMVSIFCAWDSPIASLILSQTVVQSARVQRLTPAFDYRPLSSPQSLH